MKRLLPPVLAGGLLTLFFLCLLAPASLLAPVLDDARIQGQPVRLLGTAGTVWNGSAVLEFRQTIFQLEWVASGVPGLNLSLSGGDGEVQAEVGWWLGEYQLDYLKLNFSAAWLSLFREDLQLSGRFEGQLQDVILSGSQVAGAGTLRYSGGEAQWQQPSVGSAALPAMAFVVSTQGDQLKGILSDSSGAQLGDLRLTTEQIEARLLRRATSLLGGRSAGNMNAPAFEWGRPAPW